MLTTTFRRVQVLAIPIGASPRIHVPHDWSHLLLRIPTSQGGEFSLVSHRTMADSQSGSDFAIWISICSRESDETISQALVYSQGCGVELVSQFDGSSCFMISSFVHSDRILRGRIRTSLMDTSICRSSLHQSRRELRCWWT